ncbi:MAG: hypothetical protein LBG49_01990 [Mycoplasmataceae bacterium]|jgi:hypothetical protein|nr:hypothetical protein [Mycoplasmataceae bacterium]
MTNGMIEKIQEMTEEEWQAFRQDKWNQYRQKKLRAIPPNFMGDQKKYADYLENLEKKNK